MISCDIHDYVEIACMYGFRVKLTLKSGDTISGKAIETAYDENRAECLKIESNDNEALVVLDHLASMEALVENPHFKVVNFK